MAAAGPSSGRKRKRCGQEHGQVQRVNRQAVEEVALLRADGPLGFSIIGAGGGRISFPFGTGEQGIFISKIIPGGAAAGTGKLRVGDRVLTVNGTDISAVTNQEAVEALWHHSQRSHSQVMQLTVQHQPLTKGFKEIIVVKDTEGKLGMIIGER